MKDGTTRGDPSVPGGSSVDHQLILDSMVDNVAVLAPDGEIIAVNDAWMEFARANGGEEMFAKHGVGANYLAVCERAAPDHPLAERAFEGIHSVLEGTKDAIRFEYPCHSPSEERWFSMSATALKNGKGAIVVHTNLTDLVRSRREAERALYDVAKLTDRLQAESEYLRREIATSHGFDDIIGTSDAILATLQKVQSVAHTEATVLLHGETGTGKELLARAIHSRSRRHDRPLITVDCATLPPSLIESELFGYEKGAFTGARESKAGRFELADEGTIFLDEIGELPLELQSKLLRVLEDGEIRRLGGKKEKRLNVRVIAATNRNLRQEVGEGRFRDDLYYRISVFPIEVPALRERREDIPALASFLVSRYAARFGKPIRAVSPHSLEALMAYDWPGNVRELRNVIERSVILCTADILEVEEALGGLGARSDEGLLHRATLGALIPQTAKEALEPGQRTGLGSFRPLVDVERSHILSVLEACEWKIKGAGNAAERLGLPPSTLRYRMKKLGITRP
jgi:transcriptional regulator with GAF, ATPase, and Fis domain